MTYISVECPECGTVNEVDESLDDFFCFNCGVECVLGSEYIFEPEEDAPRAPMAASGEDVEKRLKRAFLFIEDGDWDRAWSYCESALDYDPENAKAYLAELLVVLRLHSIEELIGCNIDFRGQSQYKKALRFADDDFRADLEAYGQHRRPKSREPKPAEECVLGAEEKKADRDRHARNGGDSATYNRATALMKGAAAAKSLAYRRKLLSQAICLFDSIGSFKDSRELAAKCRQMSQQREDEDY